MGAAGILVRVLSLLLLGGFVALLVYGLTTKAANTTVDDALARKQAIEAPPFDLEVLTLGAAPKPVALKLERAARDGRLSLSELREQPLVVNFWASWCPPCRQEAPLLEKTWRQSAPSGVLFVGIDIQDIRGDAREFIDEFDLSYPNIREPGKEIARSYGTTGLPETFFVSSRGLIVGHVIGAVTEQQLKEGIRAAKSARPGRAERGGERRPTR